MFSTVNSGLRRSVTTTITAGALASVAAGLALGTAGTASAEETSTTVSYNIKGMDTIDVDVECPANMHWLVDRDYAPSRNVPPGIEVVEDGGVGVTMRAFPGLARGTATNWSRYQKRVDITAHCTSDKPPG